ncbi:hypothetical protein L1987_32634 [Smallanthus sonchifolius]|uniref:Uncharacterized protein n=1 Tax=Smallanthus sonchifolius TaxID=185202 RepID=A0ACB9HN53_9ASTR|nr:hypothetical protein L1987_32634 [Smallanthus sonchifolius]
MGKLQDYIVKNRLESEFLSMGNLEKLRRQISRHKAYKAKLDHGTLPVMNQPVQSVHDQEMQERNDMINALLRIGFKEKSLTIQAESDHDYLNQSLFKQSVGEEENTRAVASFELGIENFSKEIQREKIVGWKYDVNRDLFIIRRTIGKYEYFANGHELARLPGAYLKALDKINLFNCSYPKGNDFEAFLRKQVKDNFRSINNLVKKIRKVFVEGKRHISKMVDPLLPSGSPLQRNIPQRPTVERGDQEKIRAYTTQELRWRSDEDLIALDSMKILHQPKDLHEAEFCDKCIKELVNVRRR